MNERPIQDRRVALVTGSGKRRVGWHVAQALATRGYAVAIHYHRSSADADQTVAELRSAGCDAASFQADLANEGAVGDLVQRTVEHFGRIDVLVNAAAIWVRKQLEAITAADVARHFEINTQGSFLTSLHAGLAMVKQKEGGSIINIGDWAIVRPYLGFAAYFPSKGAIPAMTRSLAVELGTRNPNVRVNAILPGPVMLPDDLPAAERDQAINATLVKREGRPEHVALAVLHFIDNDFLTGVCLPVDGGRSIYAGDD
ncbi:MAG: SDR family oxidoreductase [Planctomycetaceae bacterium]|nr:SDR family oxidoreductase [Planctomycetaceae bacterium]